MVLGYPPTVAGAAAELSARQTHRIPLVSPCEHHRSHRSHLAVMASTFCPIARRQNRPGLIEWLGCAMRAHIINDSVGFRKVMFSSHGPRIEACHHSARTFCDKAALKQTIARKAFNFAGIRNFAQKRRAIQSRTTTSYINELYKQFPITDATQTNFKPLPATCRRFCRPSK